MDPPSVISVVDSKTTVMRLTCLHLVFWLVLSCLALSCDCLVVLSCLVLSCLVLSCRLVLSCLVFVLILVLSFCLAFQSHPLLFTFFNLFYWCRSLSLSSRDLLVVVLSLSLPLSSRCVLWSCIILSPYPSPHFQVQVFEQLWECC